MQFLIDYLIFYKVDNSCDFKFFYCVIFCALCTSKNRFYSEKKDFAPKRKNFIPLRPETFQKKDNTILTELYPLNLYPFPVSTFHNCYKYSFCFVGELPLVDGSPVDLRKPKKLADIEDHIKAGSLDITYCVGETGIMKKISR